MLFFYILLNILLFYLIFMWGCGGLYVLYLKLMNVENGFCVVIWFWNLIGNFF